MEIINTPMFGILLCILSYKVGLYIKERFKITILNPLLIAIIICILVITIFKIPYESFDLGGKYITFLLAPATVCLGTSIFKQIQVIKKEIIPILIGVTAGSVTAIISVIMLSKLFNFSDDLVLSLVPKSITTAIGVEISKQIGGIPAITTLAIIITGLTGAIFAPVICKIFKIDNFLEKGVAIGMSSHAIGTSKAIEMGEKEGAFSGATIGIAGIVTAIILPIIIKFFY